MMEAKLYPSLFRKRYTLHGRFWLKQIDPDDLKAFVHIGMEAHDYGRMGGKVRASTAKRDKRGRFA